jgi:cytoskeletal protein RodZ
MWSTTFWALFFVLLVLLTFICVYVRLRRQKRRIEDLEDRVDDLKQNAGSSSSTPSDNNNNNDDDTTTAPFATITTN